VPRRTGEILGDRGENPMEEHSAIARIGTAKYNLLGFANVRWLDEELIWASQTSKKVFSYKWMADQSEDMIRRAVAERLEDGEERFWFNERPRPDVIDRLEVQFRW
jgi:hypothetical protein